MQPETATLTIESPLSRGLPLPQRLLVRRLARIRRGQLRLRIAGHTLQIGSRAGGRQADMAVRRPMALLWRLARRGDLGFAESYVAGDWDSDDPATLLQLLAENLDELFAVAQRSGIVRLLGGLRHRLRRNSLRGSRRNIAAHYDLGNDFYAEWLDRSMTYSAGLFDRSRPGGGSLEDAQAHKYERMLALIDPAPGDTILEIGCGWGGFAEYAAAHGYRVIGLTLSKEQLAYAQARVERAGLAEYVDLRLCDYRDFEERVDHIVSIEMFEAVGREYWDSYFGRLARCLRPGGRAALQVITIDEARFADYAANPGGFIQRYIFPGGMLPTKTHLRELTSAAGLRLSVQQDFGEHYADTLAHWLRRFNAKTAWLEAHGYDARFRRLWRYYLAFCEAGFRARRIDVVQVALRKD